MSIKPVMSMFATELDCLRARDKWYFEQNASQAALPAIPEGMVLVSIDLLKQLQKCSETVRSDYYRLVNAHPLPKDSGIPEMLQAFATEHDSRCAAVKALIAAGAER